MNLVPAPAFRLIDRPDNGKIPVREWCVRCWPCREHGKATLEILSRRDASDELTLLATTAKPTREETFTHIFTSCSCVALLLLFTILSYADIQSSQAQSNEIFTFFPHRAASGLVFLFSRAV